MTIKNEFELFVVSFICFCCIINIIFVSISIANFYCNGCCSNKNTLRLQIRRTRSDISSQFIGGLSPNRYEIDINRNKRSHVKPMFKIMTTLCVISFLLGSMCEVISVITEYTEYYVQFGETVSYGNTLFWYIGKITMYCLFLSRLKFSFSESIYSYSNKWYILIIILLIIESCLWFTYFLFYSKFSDEWFFKTSAIGFGLDIITSLIILILFIRQLLRVINITISSNNKGIDIDTNNIDNIDRHNRKLLNLITRYTIITGVTMISSIILGLAYSVMYYIWWKHGISNFTNWLLHLFGSPDPVVNIICLTLYYNFPISNKLYYTICCLCDTSCKRVCVWCASCIKPN